MIPNEYANLTTKQILLTLGLVAGTALSLTVVDCGQSGAASQAAPAAPAIQAVVDRVDEARIKASITRLASFPSRHSTSESCAEAAVWLRDQFLAAGTDDVSYHEFPLNGQTCRNVVATRKGTDPNPAIILVGAHYDSRSRDIGDPDAPAPGADDNASGTAGLLEVARALKGTTLRKTIRIIAFCGEEQGLVGSTAYAKLAAEEKMPITAMINMDMIGHPMDQAGREVLVESDQGNRRRENDQPSRDLAARLTRHLTTYTKLKAKPGPLYGTDYVPFEARGFVCVGLYDGADTTPFYHTDADNLDVIDTRFVAEVVRAVTATVADLAASP